jgi:hypothetical protein
MDISVYPNPKLIKRGGSAINTHYVCNKAPDVSRKVAIKEKMFYTFKNIAEETSFVPLPFFLLRLSLVNIALASISHIKILIFMGNLASHNFFFGLFPSRLKR